MSEPLTPAERAEERAYYIRIGPLSVHETRALRLLDDLERCQEATKRQPWFAKWEVERALADHLAEALTELNEWACRMPDAGFTDKSPRWDWWLARPRIRTVLASYDERRRGGQASTPAST